jgi:hypothetical protein
MRILTLALASFAIAGFCNASVIRVDDITEQISATIDGVAIANGGRVSNLTFTGESVSFDLSVNPNNSFLTTTDFTRLLDPAGSDDVTGTVSDVFTFSVVNGQTTYHVNFGSDPNLPTIPAGATDLTTISAQGLPANPYYEDGTFQQVGTAFAIAPGGGNDTFFIRSDVSGVPEPSSIALIAGGIAIMAMKRRRKLFHSRG